MSIARIRPRAAALVAVCLMAIGCSKQPDAPDAGAELTSPAPESGEWTAHDRVIRDPRGRPRILHGINVSNDVKHPPYASWAGEEDYARLQRWGYSVLRLLTGWAAIMPEEGVIDEDYLAQYDRRVDLAEQHGLLVIVDMHQDVFGEGFNGNGAPRWACDQALYDAHEPRSPWYANYGSPPVNACYDRFWTDTALQDRYIEAAAAVLGRYTDRPHVVGIDLMNEPHFGSLELDEFHRDHLQPFFERMIAALEEPGRGKLFFVEPTPIVTTLGFEPALEPFASDRVVYAPHYYHYSVHDEHEWTGTAGVIETAMLTMEATAKRLGVPWILGEHGGHVDAVGFDDYERLLLSELDRWHAGDAYWEYSKSDGGFSPLTAGGQPRPAMVDVHARVYPRAVGGALIRYGFDHRTGDFELEWRTRPDVLAPTLVAVPPRQYPDGFEVTSTDPDGAWSWSLDDAGAQMQVTADRSQATHTLTIRRPAAR